MGTAGGFFVEAISPRSVRSYSHLAEIKDISVRGSWQGLSTARLASGFQFPTWIRQGGAWGQPSGSHCPELCSLVLSEPLAGPWHGLRMGFPGLESSRVSVRLRWVWWCPLCSTAHGVVTVTVTKGTGRAQPRLPPIAVSQGTSCRKSSHSRHKRVPLQWLLCCGCAHFSAKKPLPLLGF